MGMTQEQVKRDVREREERFEQLRLMRRWAKGQREEEPLAEGRRDEC